MQDACNGMMLCYAWSSVSKPCYEPGLRTVNNLQEAHVSDNNNMQVVKFKGTQVTPEIP